MKRRSSRSLVFDPVDQSAMKVGWVISGNRNKASSRLQGYLIHEWLLINGVQSQIIAADFNQISSPYSRDFLSTAMTVRQSGATHLVFEAPEWTMVQLARLGRRWGKCVIAVRCDRIPGAYDDHFDLTILPTNGLRKALGISRAAIIDDVVEVPPDAYKQDYYARSDKIRIVWVGHSSYEPYITRLVAMLRADREIESTFTFELISTGAFATKQWSESSVVSDILDCDIALLPIPEGSWYTNKSSNRIAMMFSLGMPVVASLIPSYELFARDGENGLFVRAEREFAARLLELKSMSARRRIGVAAKSMLGDRFSIERIGPRWLSAIRSASGTDSLPCSWRIKSLDFLIRCRA